MGVKIMTYRKISDWAKDNKDILAIGEILTSDDVLSIITIKYNSWRSTFTVDASNPSENDAVLNMLWLGYVSTNLPKFQSIIDAINMGGKRSYNKTINGTLSKTGTETNTPDISNTTTNSAYSDTSENINSSVAYNTLAEKEREKSNSTANYGENTSTIKRTGTETNTRNLTDKNDVTETYSETSPEIIKNGIYMVDVSPIYIFIDRFVRQFFTI